MNTEYECIACCVDKCLQTQYSMDKINKKNLSFKAMNDITRVCVESYFTSKIIKLRIFINYSFIILYITYLH